MRAAPRLLGVGFIPEAHGRGLGRDDGDEVSPGIAAAPHAR